MNENKFKTWLQNGVEIFNEEENVEQENEAQEQLNECKSNKIKKTYSLDLTTIKMINEIREYNDFKGDNSKVIEDAIKHYHTILKI